MVDTRDLKSVNAPPLFDPQKRGERNLLVWLTKTTRDASQRSHPPFLPTSCPLFRSGLRAADIADILAGVAGQRAVTEISSNLPGWRNGRRSRLKIDFRKECGFESRSGHHFQRRAESLIRGSHTFFSRIRGPTVFARDAGREDDRSSARYQLEDAPPPAGPRRTAHSPRKISGCGDRTQRAQ